MSGSSHTPDPRAPAGRANPGPLASDDAFSKFYDQNFLPTVNWVRSHFPAQVPDRTAAEEVVEDVMAALYEERGKVTANPVEYIQGKIRNKLKYERLRTPAREPDERLIDSQARPPDSFLDSVQMKEIFGEAAASLEGDEKRLYDLYVEGKTYPEIGLVLGISRKAVEKRFAALYEHLLDIMGQFSSRVVRANPARAAREPIRTRKAAIAALQSMPRLVASILALVHVDRLPVEQVAIRLKLASREEARKFLEEGYELLTIKYGQKMPEELEAALANDGRQRS